MKIMQSATNVHDLIQLLHFLTAYPAYFILTSLILPQSFLINSIPYLCGSFKHFYKFLRLLFLFQTLTRKFGDKAFLCRTALLNKAVYHA